MLQFDTGQPPRPQEPLARADAAACGGKMTFRNAVFSLANTIIGSGTLTMPFIFAGFGWLPANLVSVLIMLLTTYSVYLLVLASDRAGDGVPRSYEALGSWCCGAPGSVYAQATFICGGLGTLTGYMIFIGKLWAQVVGLDADQAYIPILAVLVVAILPLTCPRKIHALRHASVAAVFAILYVAVMYLWFAVKIGRYDDPTGAYVYAEVQLATWTPHSISSVNLLIGAFCVQNTCLPVYGELMDRSPRKMVGATVCAMLLSFAVYEVIGLSGYFLLGGNVPGNSLLALDGAFVRAHPWASLPRDLAKVSMACLLALSFPLAMWPCRSALCSLLQGARRSCRRGDGEPRAAEGASDALFRGATWAILAVVTVLAIRIPDVETPLSLVNSLAGGSMIFVMPGLFYLGSLEDRSARFSAARWPVFAMLALGALCCVLGFGLQVRSLALQRG